MLIYGRPSQISGTKKQNKKTYAILDIGFPTTVDFDRNTETRVPEAWWPNAVTEAGAFLFPCAPSSDVSLSTRTLAWKYQVVFSIHVAPFWSWLLHIPLSIGHFTLMGHYSMTPVSHTMVDLTWPKPINCGRSKRFCPGLSGLICDLLLFRHQSLMLQAAYSFEKVGTQHRFPKPVKNCLGDTWKR